MIPPKYRPCYVELGFSLCPFILNIVTLTYRTSLGFVSYTSKIELQNSFQPLFLDSLDLSNDVDDASIDADDVVDGAI